MALNLRPANKGQELVPHEDTGYATDYMRQEEEEYVALTGDGPVHAAGRRRLLLIVQETMNPKGEKQRQEMVYMSGEYHIRGPMGNYSNSDRACAGALMPPPEDDESSDSSVPEAPSRKEKLIDSVCSCECRAQFKKGCCCRLPIEEIKLPESLRKMQELGVEKFFRGLVDIYTKTPLGSTVKSTIVYVQFLVAILLFGITVMRFINDGKSFCTASKARIILSSIAFVWMLFDTLIHTASAGCRCIPQWRTYCRARNYTCDFRMYWRDRAEGRRDELTESEEVNNFGRDARFFENQCAKVTESKPALTVGAFADMVRLLISEVLYYPILLLNVAILMQDIFEIESNATTENQVLLYVLTEYWPNLVNVLLSIILQIFSVYIARSYALVASWHDTKKERKFLTTGKHFQWGNSYIHAFFVVYMIANMIIQICIILEVGILYLHTVKNQSQEITNATCYVSPDEYTWYFIAVGFFHPYLAVISFFVAYRPYVQLFFLKLTADTEKTCTFDEQELDKFSRHSCCRKFFSPLGNCYSVLILAFYLYIYMYLSAPVIVPLKDEPVMFGKTYYFTLSLGVDQIVGFVGGGLAVLFNAYQFILGYIASIIWLLSVICCLCCSVAQCLK